MCVGRGTACGVSTYFHNKKPLNLLDVKGLDLLKKGELLKKDHFKSFFNGTSGNLAEVNSTW